MIPTRDMIARLWSAVACALLLVVTAHAVAPVEPEFGRRSGSAFNASTQDVSLKNGSRVEVARQMVRAEPAVPPAARQVITTRPADDSPHGTHRRPAAAGGFVPGGIEFAPVGARAPPLV